MINFAKCRNKKNITEIYSIIINFPLLSLHYYTFNKYIIDIFL